MILIIYSLSKLAKQSILRVFDRYYDFERYIIVWKANKHLWMQQTFLYPAARQIELKKFQTLVAVSHNKNSLQKYLFPITEMFSWYHVSLKLQFQNKPALWVGLIYFTWNEQCDLYWNASSHNSTIKWINRFFFPTPAIENW